MGSRVRVPPRSPRKTNNLARFPPGSKKPRVGTVWALCGQMRYAPGACHVRRARDWNFVNEDDAKAEIRAAVEYLLRGATGGGRGDIVQEIIALVRDVANALPAKLANPLDDDMPGGW